MSEVADATRVVGVHRHGDVAIVTIDNPPVNAASRAVRAALLDAIREIEASTEIAAAVIACAGKTFMAGADIREFGRPIEEPALPAIVAAILASRKPFVAAIHGAALGGGFELALACDARVAAKDAVVGLPEVTLGIVPGAGGTQHLPRIVGLSKAIEIVCSGRRVRAGEALELGLVDRVVKDEVVDEAVKLARSMAGRKSRVSERRVPAADSARVEEAAQAALKAGRKRPQVVAAIESVRRAATMPYAEALQAERAAFNTLREGTEAAALRYLFFAERESSKLPDIEGVAALAIASVSVIGAGTMGAGIATSFADAGYQVTLMDRDDAAVERGFERIRKTYAGSVAAGRIDEQECQERVARIRRTTDLAAAAQADLVVEAVFEDMKIKKSVFAELDRAAPPGTILATNTSYLDVDEIAAVTSRAPSG